MHLVLCNRDNSRKLETCVSVCVWGGGGEWEQKKTTGNASEITRRSHLVPRSSHSYCKKRPGEDMCHVREFALFSSNLR